jgi:hypothetical protein
VSSVRLVVPRLGAGAVEVVFYGADETTSLSAIYQLDCPLAARVTISRSRWVSGQRRGDGGWPGGTGAFAGLREVVGLGGGSVGGGAGPGGCT